MTRTQIFLVALLGVVPSVASADRIDRFAPAVVESTELTQLQLWADVFGRGVLTDVSHLGEIEASSVFRTVRVGTTTLRSFDFDHTGHSTVREAYTADARSGGQGSRPDNRWLQSGTILSGPNAEPPSFRTPGNISRLASGGVVVKDGGDPEVVVPLPSAALMSLAGLGVVACRRRR